MEVAIAVQLLSPLYEKVTRENAPPLPKAIQLAHDSMVADQRLVKPNTKRVIEAVARVEQAVLHQW